MSETATTLRRIDPQAIARMFARWDGALVPANGCFYRYQPDGDGCCVNMILAIAVAGHDRAVAEAAHLSGYRHAARLARLSGLHPDYAIGLALGWDGNEDFLQTRANLFAKDMDACRLGFRDGRAAWRACQPECVLVMV
jgi:hypothetical protein